MQQERYVDPIEINEHFRNLTWGLTAQKQIQLHLKCIISWATSPFPGYQEDNVPQGCQLGCQIQRERPRLTDELSQLQFISLVKLEEF